MSELKTYKVPFAYERYGHITVKADTIINAYNKAADELDKMTVWKMEENSEYLEFSEEIDIEDIVRDKDGNIIEK